MPEETNACFKHLAAIQKHKGTHQNTASNYATTIVVGHTSSGKPIEERVCKDKKGVHPGEKFVPKHSSFPNKKIKK
jgi:hypothetical protein